MQLLHLWPVHYIDQIIYLRSYVRTNAFSLNAYIFWNIDLPIQWGIERSLIL